ncbi:MAG: hypothetical protein HYY49_14220 [Ignavibacteriales bacterium]|nr:hypothetical protein [Ignavibacteriales bacterium]
MPEKPNKQRAVLLGGLVIGSLWGIPFVNMINCCCCAGILLGGIMASYLYREEFVEGMPPFESSDALITGLLAGIVGALVATFISNLIHLAFGPVGAEVMKDIIEKVLQRLEEQGSIPTGMYDEMLEQLEREINKPLTLYEVLKDLLFSVIILPIFGMLGGLLGFAIFGKKKTAQPA